MFFEEGESSHWGRGVLVDMESEAIDEALA